MMAFQDFQIPHPRKYYWIIIIVMFVDGFFLGGYYFANYQYFGVKFSDLVTLNFTVVLIYFSWIQNRFINLQYNLALEQSQSSLIVAFDESKNCFFIKNEGRRSAYDVICTLFDYTNNETHVFETIEEIYARSSHREYYPFEWREKQECIIDIIITYQTGINERILKETIEYNFN